MGQKDCERASSDKISTHQLAFCLIVNILNNYILTNNTLNSCSPNPQLASTKVNVVTTNRKMSDDKTAFSEAIAAKFAKQGIYRKLVLDKAVKGIDGFVVFSRFYGSSAS